MFVKAWIFNTQKASFWKFSCLANFGAKSYANSLLRIFKYLLVSSLCYLRWMHVGYSIVWIRFKLIAFFLHVVKKILLMFHAKKEEKICAYAYYAQCCNKVLNTMVFDQDYSTQWNLISRIQYESWMRVKMFCMDTFFFPCIFHSVRLSFSYPVLLASEKNIYCFAFWNLFLPVYC